jgi:3-phenylpropionate/cinnamic acid dioxygenase small subunit
VSEDPNASATGAPLDPETRWQVSEVLARCAHIVDSQEWAQLPSVFTADAAVDAQYATVHGLAEIQVYLESFGPWRSHHTINTITRFDGGRSAVGAWSRFLVVEASGVTVSGDYIDALTATDGGWRIRSRRISLRNRSDQTPDGEPWRTESFASWHTG